MDNYKTGIGFFLGLGILGGAEYGWFPFDRAVFLSVLAALLLAQLFAYHMAADLLRRLSVELRSR